MSIGELLNLYKDEELDIHPEFQRVFRWTNFQKTRLIESIVLNIPIPPIFVSQREDGVWDVIDGVQRLSTIFQFVGIYKPEVGSTQDSSFTLEGTKYLPSFQGVSWDNDNPKLRFTTEQKINFKRSRIDVIIVKKESDQESKYELFQRLNTGGSHLSAQEVRNCMIIMCRKSFYDLLSYLSTTEDFNLCIPITERLIREQYRMELILRLLIAVYSDQNQLSSYSDLTNLIDKETINLCNNFDRLETVIMSKFIKVFQLLNEAEGENVFKRHFEEGSPRGAFLSSAFQGIATGILDNLDKILKLPDIDRTKWITEKIRGFYKADTFNAMMGQGVKPITRFLTLSSFGKQHFSFKDYGCINS